MESVGKNSQKSKKILKVISILLITPIVAIVAMMLLVHVWVEIDTFYPDTVDIQYMINSDQKTCTVIGADPSERFSLTIPKEIDGYIVTGIAEGAFKDYEMTIVVLPDTIEKIGDGAFENCGDLKEVRGLEKCASLTSIGNSTFQYCTTLTRMKLPSNIRVIGNYAFYQCQAWKDVTVPNNTQKIGSAAYAGCFGLKNTDIYIPASVTDIGDMAFLGCERLTNIIVDEANPYWASIDGVLYSKDLKTLYCYPIGRKNEIFTIPEGVENIYYKAFALALHLKEINLPSSIKTIGEQVFVTAEDLKIKIEKLNYSENAEMWGSVQKPQEWGDNSSDFIIYCTDGTISKDGTSTVSTFTHDNTTNPDTPIGCAE